MGNRRKDDVGDAIGCLIVMVLLGLIWALVEVFRAKPHVYTPIGLDNSRLKRADIHSWDRIATGDVASQKSTRADGRTVGVVALIFWILAVVASSSENDSAVGVLMCGGIAGLVGGVLWSARSSEYDLAATEDEVSQQDDAIEQLSLSVPVVYTIAPASQRKGDLAVDVNLLSALVEAYPGLTYQIHATAQETQWRVVDFENRYKPEIIADTIGGYFDDQTLVTWKHDPNENDNNEPFYRAHAFFYLAAEYAHPLPTLDTIKDYDPLIPLVRRLDFLQAEYGEIVIYSLIARTKTITASTQASRRIQENLVDGLKGFDVLERKHQEFVTQKLRSPLFHCLLVMTLESRESERITELAELVNGIGTMECSYCNRLWVKWSPIYKIDTEIQDHQTSLAARVQSWANGTDREWRKWLLVLCPQEMVVLWHLPDERFTAANIAWNQSRYVRMPDQMKQVMDGILVGTNQHGGREHEVKLPKTGRTEHMTIVGKTGVGKSSLMHRMIHSDIQNGLGVCLIDPKGTLVSDILQHSVPKQRKQDVVVLDIFTPVDGVFHPPPLNVLANYGGASDDVSARKLLSIFATIFNDFADRKMADTFNMSLMTVGLEKTPTLLDVHRLLTNETYRERLTKKLRKVVVRDYWHNFEALKDGQQQSQIEPVLWRMRAFYNNDHLQAITCHPDRLDLKRLIAENKIILVSLGADDNVVPREERYILGAALVSQIEMVVRQKIIQKPPYMLYVDEAQEFVRTALPEMLSQLRQYGLGIVLANQFYKQLSGDTFDAVEGTVSTIVCFEVGKTDANLLATYMQPGFKATDLVALGKYHAAVSVRAPDGERLPAFSLKTLPPPGYGKRYPKRELTLRRLSVENYTPKTYDQVVDWIHRRYFGDGSLSEAQDAPGMGGDDEFFEPE